MKPSDTLLVTGAAGHLGRRVIEALLLTVPARKLIATTRSPEKLADFALRGVTVRAADFNRPAGLEAAFSGAARMLLISTDAIGERVKSHRNAIEAARKAGVEHVVYTSLPNPETSLSRVAPDHHATETLIRESGLSHAILRNNLYAENLLLSLPSALAMGKLLGAAGNGRIAYVTREDCARTAAAALASTDRSSSVRDVSGPEALSYQDIARIAGELTGRELPYHDLPPEEFKRALMKSGLPDLWAETFLSFDLAAKQGTLSSVTTTVKELTGSEPTSVRNFLKASSLAQRA
ncbi:MAG: SDR family oxidoreductase [Oligoflexia bacterium]|nr:SDR family oxidoreductase [Oligoflexia bacterium]